MNLPKTPQGNEKKQKIVHSIQIEPGVMMVSAKLANYIKSHIPTSKVGDMFGVDIIETDYLPLVMDED